MNYEKFFVSIKSRVLADLGEYFTNETFDNLTLSLSYAKRSQPRANDQYRSRAAKVPAYYNPNTHSVHLNVNVIQSAAPTLVENIYYHELVHASSHHARMEYNDCKILKSGLKIQMWDDFDKPTTLHRGLNEGLTQYFANSNTSGGPAYKREVAIVGRLIQKMGMKELKEAYFGSAIDRLEQKMAATFGANTLGTLSALIDQRRYDEAEAVIG